jgi:hypothetical protein
MHLQLVSECVREFAMVNVNQRRLRPEPHLQGGALARHPAFIIAMLVLTRTHFVHGKD